MEKKAMITRARESGRTRRASLELNAWLTACVVSDISGQPFCVTTYRCYTRFTIRLTHVMCQGELSHYYDFHRFDCKRSVPDRRLRGRNALGGSGQQRPAQWLRSRKGLAGRSGVDARVPDALELCGAEKRTRSDSGVAQAAAFTANSGREGRKGWRTA